MIRGLTRTIPGRILVALLSIYISTYIATALVVYSGVRASVLESNATALNQLADLKHRQLDSLIEASATNLTAWSRLDVMNDLVSGDIDKRVADTLDELKQLYSLPGDIYAFDADDQLIAATSAAAATVGLKQIPAQWQLRGNALKLLAKQRDPVSGDDVLTLEIPVFGRFDRDFRIGTLVLTNPWNAIQALLFSPGGGSILLEPGSPARVLAADPPNIVGRINLDRIDFDVATDGSVVGRSLARAGPIADWTVLTLQGATAANRLLQSVALELALLGIFLAVPIVFLGRWLSRRLTAPIADLTRVMGAIADTDRLDARAPVPDCAELGSLARSFNRMTDNLERATDEREALLHDLSVLNQGLEAKIAARTAELEAAIRAQRRLIGDISHEIKSPLARLSIALGLARRATPEDRPRQHERIEKEIESIAALASELLTLARLEGAAPPPPFALLDLRELVDRVLADAAYEAPSRSGDLSFARPADKVVVSGNAELLCRAIENIVRNAIFYTTPGTEVKIILGYGAAGRMKLTVADRGPGVPQASHAHLFEPFYRVDEARARETGGSGVGLAICERVVHLHAGTIRARDNRPSGLVVEIELPASNPLQGGDTAPGQP
ncbi:MAG: ATP-binding protein [Rhodospirillales bacterium]